MVVWREQMIVKESSGLFSIPILILTKISPPRFYKIMTQDEVCGINKPYQICFTLGIHFGQLVTFNEGFFFYFYFFAIDPSLITKVQSSHRVPWWWRGGLIAMVANFDSSQASGSISNRIGIDHDEYHCCLLGISILPLFLFFDKDSST